ncbi:MAG: hypothetical protein WCL23_05760 [Candidatus Moraniibacteriota bacterium]
MNTDHPKVYSESQIFEMISQYFITHGFNCAKLDPASHSKSHSIPDYEILQNGHLVAYCEVKSPQYIVNADTRMFQWNTLFNKLKTTTRKAAKQLTTHDPENIYPKIVIYTSSHFQLMWLRFTDFLQGVIRGNGQIIRDFRTNTEYISELKKTLHLIDAFMWMQISSKDPEIIQISFFINKQSIHVDRTTQILSKLIPTSELISCTNLHKNCSCYSHYFFYYNPEILQLLPFQDAI